MLFKCSTMQEAIDKAVRKNKPIDMPISIMGSNKGNIEDSKGCVISRRGGRITITPIKKKIEEEVCVGMERVVSA